MPTSAIDVAIGGMSIMMPADRGHPRADWFDYRRELGSYGYKYLPPAVRYLLAAARHALADVPPEDRDNAPRAEASGLVVGTSNAVAGLHATMDRTIVATSSADLSPALAPYFSVNLGGGRLAAEHSLKGFHVTLTTPRIAGLEAIEVAARALALGRASSLLVGALEEVLDAGEPAAPRSESGAVVLAVHAPGKRATGRGRCRVRTYFVPPSGAAESTARAVLSAAFTAIRARPGCPVVAVLDTSRLGLAIRAGLGERARFVPAGAGCLEPLVQVAGALAAATEPTVVVSAAAEGNLAIALVTPATQHEKGI